MAKGEGRWHGRRGTKGKKKRGRRNPITVKGKVLKKDLKQRLKVRTERGRRFITSSFDAVRGCSGSEGSNAGAKSESSFTDGDAVRSDGSSFTPSKDSRCTSIGGSECEVLGSDTERATAELLEESKKFEKTSSEEEEPKAKREHFGVIDVAELREAFQRQERKRPLRSGSTARDFIREDCNPQSNPTASSSSTRTKSVKIETKKEDGAAASQSSAGSGPAPTAN